jgi:hypothetical protein
VDARGERDSRHLRARPDAELLEDVRDVELDRVLADDQLGGDVAVAVADRHEANLELTLAKRPDQRARGLFGLHGVLDSGRPIMRTV